MAGESILVIDESLAVQEIARTALQAAGYRVTTAANGAAALTCPGVEDQDLIVLDHALSGLSSEQTTMIFKQEAKTHTVPILLLVPEDNVPERESLALAGVVGYLLKPFDPRDLVRKVEQAFRQRSLDEIAIQALVSAADRLIREKAEGQIQASVERKTAIIIERAIQNVVAAVDARAKGEVDTRVGTLISEKEQELVKLTVREVANSMVEKLAERKVEEAGQTILNEQTERVVKRSAEQIVPNMIRDKVKDMLANILPREVETKLQKAAEKMVPEISEQLVSAVDAVAQKNVPRIGRELMPPVVELQVRQTLDQALPRRVAELVAQELREQMLTKIDPTIRDAAARIRKSVLWLNILMLLITAAGVGFVIMRGLGK